jgi:hypothetical protein
MINASNFPQSFLNLPILEADEALDLQIVTHRLVHTIKSSNTVETDSTAKVSIDSPLADLPLKTRF